MHQVPPQGCQGKHHTQVLARSRSPEGLPPIDCKYRRPVLKLVFWSLEQKHFMNFSLNLAFAFFTYVLGLPLPSPGDHQAACLLLGTHRSLDPSHPTASRRASAPCLEDSGARKYNARILAACNSQCVWQGFFFLIWATQEGFQKHWDKN